VTVSILLKRAYSRRYSEILKPIACKLDIYLNELLCGVPRIDTVSVRPKSISSFIEKSLKTNENGKQKYDDPIHQIQDQIGARVVTLYRSSRDPVKDIIRAYLAPIEVQAITPPSPSVFEYEGWHFILFLPEDILDNEMKEKDCPKFFELQIRTLFQHAWAEANHNIFYKSTKELDFESQRKCAFTAAQAWGADLIFDQLAEKSD